MNPNKEKVSLLYFEPILNSKNFSLGYETACRQNAEEICGRYRKKTDDIKALGDVEVELKIIETNGPLIQISGTSKSIERVLRERVFPHFYSVCPQTRILLPEKEIEGCGSSENGYRIAKEIIVGLGHKVRKSGRILRKGFEF